MSRIWRQNPFLRILIPFLWGFYGLDDFRGTFIFLVISMTLFFIARLKKIILWTSTAIFCLLISCGSAWNALIPQHEILTLCPTDWEMRPQADHGQSEILFASLQQHYSSDDAGIIIAFLIGDTHFIPKSIAMEYKSIGVSHLLAVSGMHIGLLFAAIAPMLGWITQKKFMKTTTLITLVIIWIFCYVCQFTPSILRAGIMFTFLHGGKLWNLKSPTLNLLSLSFLIIILIFPEDKLNWGLILSHLAVAGIVLFHRPVHMIIASQKKWIQYLIQSMVTTIHAQWMTGLFLMPKTLTFPTYFLLANFILVPLSSILMYAFILLILLKPIWTWFNFHFIIQWGIQGMNSIVHFINGLPQPSFTFHHWSAAHQLIWFTCGMLAYLIWNRNWKGVRHFTILFGFAYFISSEWEIQKRHGTLHLWRDKGMPVMMYDDSETSLLYPVQHFHHSFYYPDLPFPVSH
jgi:competence protein ComEC